MTAPEPKPRGRSPFGRRASYFSSEIAAVALSLAVFMSPALQAASASFTSPLILLISVPVVFAPASDRGA